MCGGRRLAVLNGSQAEPRSDYIRNIVPFCKLWRKANRTNRPMLRSLADRRIDPCAWTRSVISMLSCKRPWQCLRLLEWTLRSEKLQSKRASGLELSIVIFRSALTLSWLSSGARSTPAPTPQRPWRPNMNPAKRWRDGCSAMWTSSPPSADLQPPCTRATRRMKPCPPTSKGDSGPHSRLCSKQRPQPVRCAPVSNRTICCERSQACVRRLTTAIPRIRGAWLPCWWTVYVTA